MRTVKDLQKETAMIGVWPLIILGAIITPLGAILFTIFQTIPIIIISIGVLLMIIALLKFMYMMREIRTKRLEDDFQKIKKFFVKEVPKHKMEQALLWKASEGKLICAEEEEYQYNIVKKIYNNIFEWDSSIKALHWDLMNIYLEQRIAEEWKED